MGWDAYSIDVSELAVEAAAARIGESRSLLGVPEFLVGTCDVVTLWCVVAHVPDPRAVIVDALRLLKKDGRLLLSTPNFLFQARYAALAAKIGRPIDFVAADHFMHFTPASIDRVLADAGGVRLAFAHWGITPECVLEQRLAGVLVPCKRIWNRVAFTLSQFGVAPYYSELHVEATHAGSALGV
jgi:SAM-dependent methyltransferase